MRFTVEKWFETLVFAELRQQSDHLNAHVMIRASAKGTGKITIHFSNNEQLESLVSKLRE